MSQTITNYSNGAEYDGSNNLVRLQHTEGSIVNNNGTFGYEYVLRDHLGNTRVTFNANSTGVLANGDIKQINSYYPFGLNMEGPGFGAQGSNKYQYNGIELNTEFGLNINTAFFRSYDAAVGRWWQVDPRPTIAETPFSGMGNNPIRLNDPLGDSTWVYTIKGRYVGQINDNTDNQVHFITSSNMKRAKSFNSENIRKFSSYYIGRNTMNSLRSITAKAVKTGYERAFVYGIQKGQKELTVVDVSQNAQSSEGNGMNFTDDGMKSVLHNNPNLTIIGWGHAHPQNQPIGNVNSPSASGFGERDNLGRLVLKDFASFGIVNPFISDPNYISGYNPSILTSRYGFNIYSTVGTNSDGIDLNISHYRIEERNIYNFNQNRIVHDFPFKN